MKNIRIWQWLGIACAAIFLSVNAFVATNQTAINRELDLLAEASDNVGVVNSLAVSEGRALRVKRHKKSSGFEEDGGHKHGEEHYGKEGKKGDKGYKKKHHWDKGDKGIEFGVNQKEGSIISK